MKKSILILLVLTMALGLAACAGSGSETSPKTQSEQAGITNPQTSTLINEPEDTTEYATSMWDKAKMNGLEPPKADLTGEVQDTGVVKYLFTNIKKVNAEKYVQYLKDSGYTTSPLEMSSTKYRAVNGGYEVIFSCSDFNSEDIGSGEIQMVKK